MISILFEIKKETAKNIGGYLGIPIAAFAGAQVGNYLFNNTKPSNMLNPYLKQTSEDDDLIDKIRAYNGNQFIGSLGEFLDKYHEDAIRNHEVHVLPMAIGGAVTAPLGNLLGQYIGGKIFDKRQKI